MVLAELPSSLLNLENILIEAKDMMVVHLFKLSLPLICPTLLVFLVNHSSLYLSMVQELRKHMIPHLLSSDLKHKTYILAKTKLDA